MNKLLLACLIAAGQAQAAWPIRQRGMTKINPQKFKHLEEVEKNLKNLNWTYDHQENGSETYAVAVAQDKAVLLPEGGPRGYASSAQEEVPSKPVLNQEFWAGEKTNSRPKPIAGNGPAQKQSFLDSAYERAGQFMMDPSKTIRDAVSSVLGRTQAILDRLKVMATGRWGLCLRAVRQAAEWGYGIRWRDHVPAWALVGAHQFGLFVDQDKKGAIHKLGYAQVPTLTPENKPDLATGDMIIWSAGLCSFNADHGHIEMITSLNPPRAFSNGGQNIRKDCLMREALIDKNAGRTYRIKILRPLDGKLPSDYNAALSTVKQRITQL